ncbi:MAG: urease accessory UreF family protein [Verrucomicrobiota bacterium]
MSRKGQSRTSLSGDIRSLGSSSPSDSELLLRSYSVATLGVDIKVGSFFAPHSFESLEADWQSWRQAQLHAAFLLVKETHARVSTLNLDRLAELDSSLEALPQSGAMRLAGTAFFEGKQEMQSHLEWKKYAKLVEEGSAPGHSIVVFTIHAHLFRLPLVEIFNAYAWFEWVSGLASLPERAPEALLTPTSEWMAEVAAEAARALHHQPEQSIGLRAV